MMKIVLNLVFSSIGIFSFCQDINVEETREKIFLESSELACKCIDSVNKTKVISNYQNCIKESALAVQIGEALLKKVKEKKKTKTIEINNDSSSSEFQNSYVKLENHLKENCNALSKKSILADKIQEKYIDKNFVGTWIGSEENQETEGMSKKWKMIRKDDGSFTLDFEYTKNGETKKLEDSGTWYIQGNRFYEYHNSSELTDIYDFEILTPDSIKFSMVFSDLNMKNPEYTFIDYRVKE
jgi:hypothetical protein